jgi:hypothetical protein
MEVDELSSAFSQFLPLDTLSNEDFVPSDSSSTVSTAAEGAMSKKDYWFGKKYFQCILAQGLLRITPDEEDISSIDVCYE